MAKAKSLSLDENTEQQLEEIEDVITESGTSAVIRRIVDEYYQGKNTFHYLQDNNEQ